jgi:hypothetical protein
MIEAGLEFDGAIDRVVRAFVDLPAPLRPVHFSHEEKPTSDADRIDDCRQFATFVAKSKSGFFLLGPGLTYSLRRTRGKSLICDCFLEVAPEGAERFLRHMSKALPIFGFACMPAERERRNRVTTRQGTSKIESWVGRDTQRYVPGLYWLTLLPEALARQHGLSLAAVNAVARQHLDLGNGQHLFRLYNRPEEWLETSSSAVTDLRASLPGVFNVENIKPQLEAAKNFLDLNVLLREWR